MTPQDTMTAEEIAAWEQQLRGQEHEEPVAVLRERHVRALNSSRLINEACEIAWRRWPDERLFTFVDPKYASANPGYCFQLAGFKLLPGTTQRGLRVLERLP